MLILPLASAVVAIGLGVVAGLGLVVTLFVRQQRQVEALRAELQGVRTMHKDGAADVRSRLEEASRVMREVQDEVQALVEARESVATTAADVQILKGTVEAMAPAFDGLNERLGGVAAELESLATRVGEVEQRGSEAEAGVESVREEWQRIQSMVDKSERQLAVFAEDREAEETRLAELRSAVGTLRGTVEERIAVQEERLEKLETGPRAQLEAAAQGLDTRAAVGDDGGEAEPAPTPTPRLRRDPIEEDEDDERGARWIFLVMAGLLALALVAQYVRSLG
ncbi:MAG: hypothetical protein QNJ98_14045 [Planctomycetota bacterium]|nr:hypothetical protein [Planctomycetota bacterium]